jgi:hypothetical protein
MQQSRKVKRGSHPNPAIHIVSQSRLCHISTMARPLFYKSVYANAELDACFGELIHSRVSEQDKIEIGCLIQYFSILAHYGLFSCPVDLIKNRQGQGPDFTICNGDVFGVEMTKVTTADYQVWLKKRLNYRAIKNLADYTEFRPEARVSDLAKLRVERKNYKISAYFAAQPQLEYCDLVLEEDGDCGMDLAVLFELLKDKLPRIHRQRFRRISMISGSVLYYAINTADASVLSAPEIRPDWLFTGAKAPGLAPAEALFGAYSHAMH